MRLALVSRRYPPLIGGAEKVLSYLAQALADEGARVSVLTSSLGVPDAALEGLRVPDAGLDVIHLPTSRARFVGTWLYMKNLVRWFARNPIDLAYVSMLKHDAYATLGAGRRRGFPVVLRPEGAGATGDLAWQSWGTFGQTIGRRCRAADSVVSISSAITSELVASGYDRGRVHEIPNGVPVPGQAWQPRSAPGDDLEAVYVGRLAPEKGIDTLIDAWVRVIAERPGARLRLVGEGPERPALNALIDRHGLARSVLLPGASADVGAQLRAADLFVLPSREEGMSIALLEAMAVGIPLVATAIPGNLRLVADGVHGRLVPPNSAEALATAILAQWHDYPHACSMAREARVRVIREFSISAVAKRHLVLFESLMRARRNPGSSPAIHSV